MKKFIAMLLALVMVLALCACGSSAPAAAPAATQAPAAAPAAEPAAPAAEPAAPAAEEPAEGKVFNIYAWNEEFKGFFEKYYKVPDGVTVNWVIVPSDNGAYQDALDAALLNQASADADKKVDMFLAEADYILKYVDSDFTQDIQALGVTDFSNAYKYTVQAASDAAGTVKGVSFQCCPSQQSISRR